MSELTIGGIPATQLAAEYQTPLYVYDQAKIEETITAFKDNFQSKQFKTKIIYASKAFQTVAMINLVAKFGLGLDVVSGGEIYTALQSKMPKAMIYFHGNNKTPAELDYFLTAGLTHVICDNLMEVTLLNQLAEKLQTPVQVMLRLNVGIDAHTHEYIITAHIDSKFGMAYESQDCQEALEIIANSPYLQLEGFHAHIGSQIFEMTAWQAEIDKLVSYLADFNEKLSLNLGGGFGIRYVASDEPLAPAEVARELIDYTENALTKAKQTINELIIEPGRSLVGEAGTTLYTVGYIKQTPHKKYYFVDGGMTDNIRPALYQAEYSCDIANRLGEEKTETVTVAGKMCESGDVVIQAADLPQAEPGDVLAVYATGAYGYSMSSNYNRATTPAVVFVKNGQSRLVVKRQTYADLLRNEVMDDETSEI